MEKEFKVYLLLNWKTGKARLVMREKRAKSQNAYEVPVRFEIVVELPEQKEIVAKGKVTLSETQVGKMLIEQL